MRFNKSFTRSIWQGFFGSVMLKLSSTLLGLALAILLSRTLGPSGYGAYTYVYVLVSFVAMPVQLGLPTLVIRETAKAQVENQWSIMNGLWIWSFWVSVIFSISILLLAISVVFSFDDQFSFEKKDTFVYAMLLLPLTVLGGLFDGALSGLRRVLLGQFANTVLRPGLFILLILMVLIFFPEVEQTPADIMKLHVLAALVAFSTRIVFLIQCRPNELRANTSPIYDIRSWLSAAIPFAIMGGMQLINQYTDILMLGFFSSDEQVGLYRVASQGAVLVVFGRQAVLSVILPYFTRMHAQDDLEGLQRLVTMSARVTLAFSLPAVIILCVWGSSLLRIVFGDEYVSAHMALVILAIGQMLNASLGPAAQLLNMTGYERDTTKSLIISACANILLNLAFIPPLGIVGAATATAVTLVLWNVFLWYSVHKRLCIESSVVGKFPIAKD